MSSYEEIAQKLWGNLKEQEANISLMFSTWADPSIIRSYVEAKRGKKEREEMERSKEKTREEEEKREKKEEEGVRKLLESLVEQSKKLPSGY
ncbi:MAG: hypothetical protein NZ992_05955, partial [Candidatus Korarchaeum sp.]|nr:hypothetical protein [Candidatus Korarchaeum sp.]